MAVELLLLRHGPTAWNRAGRLQGRHDEPLDAPARAALAGRRLPARFASWPVYTSPLRRARETAAALGAEAVVDPLLVEMDMGAFEGLTRDAIVARWGAAWFAALEARGPAFRPPGGECPLDLQARLRAFARARRDQDPGVVAVTHKGVIRAALALAAGWDLTGRAPVRLDWSCGHLFAATADATFTLLEPNIALEDGGLAP
ncbi:MAG: histidine phosphatase family protein [Chromatiales bacterium]|nr:histidine phosphatase family protein [Chromatiales bacterium]